MNKIPVKLSKRSYNIIVGKGIISQLPTFISSLNIGHDAYIITNPYIKRTFGHLLTGPLKKSGFNFKFKSIADSEKSKSLNTAYTVIKDLARFDKQKRVFVIAFGGGVVGDLSGFVASIYKRGIPYIQIPTTLLAQIDSSIGGKTAVDLSLGKNLAGSFYQPRLVLSDVDFLKKLPVLQIQSGIAEAIKYGAIKDAKLFKFLETNTSRILSKDPAALKHIVSCCSKIKADIVSKDETEKHGIRTILNFGHTIGHAIEAAANYKKYNHGQAVALGMIAASYLSVLCGDASDQTCFRIQALIKKFALPTKLKGISSSKIIKAQFRDKKFSGAKNRFVLIGKIGKVLIAQDIPLSKIKEALSYLY